jgi:hypothetical protein
MAPMGIASPLILLLAAVSAPPDEGRICFSRGEQNGYVNTVPVEIKVDEGGIWLAGGDATCLDLPTGAHTLWLSWRWDARNPNSDLYRSPAYRIRLTTNEVQTLSICPVANPPEREDAPTWILGRDPCPSVR